MSLTDTTGVKYVIDFLLLENLSKAVSVNLNCAMNGQRKWLIMSRKKFMKLIIAYVN